MKAWLNHLLDRHGTGRVLYRNTRSAVKGFPDRQLNEYSLETPGQYLSLATDTIHEASDHDVNDYGNTVAQPHT